MNIYFSLAAVLISLFIGWQTHTWYDGYKGEHQAIVAEQRAGKGESKIIKDTQTITKELSNDKDNCLKEYIPAPVLKQLH